MGCVYLCKKCNCCGKLLPIIAFGRNKRYKFKKENTCKKCKKENYHKNKMYYKEKRDANKDYYKKYRDDNKNKTKKYNEEYRKNNSDKIKKYKKEYYLKNKEYYKEYRKKNNDRIKEYRDNNKEYHKIYYKEWIKNNPEKQFNKHHNRRVRKQNQGNGITGEQWQEMMNYFDWKCAYSGEYIGGNKNSSIRTIDHIVPLSEYGENEIWNLVPMHRTYNSRKSTKDVEMWYPVQDFYSEERLNKIYEWQNYAYNKWGNDSDVI